MFLLRQSKLVYSLEVFRWMFNLEKGEGQEVKRLVMLVDIFRVYLRHKTNSKYNKNTLVFLGIYHLFLSCNLFAR